MNFNRLLNEVLNTVTQSAGQLNKPSQSTADTITKVGGGAALAGILSMVLGRKGGAKLTKLGSLAALGSLAYQAYQNYQKNQPVQQNTGELSQEAFVVTPQTEDNSAIILRTMIAAAMSDGVLEESERALIMQEGGDDPALQQWLEQEIMHPLSVSEIAKIVGKDTALATQVYLAARMVCQDLSRKEIVFLGQLAQALNLDDALVEQLEKQAGF
ncbi:TPA: tellurite resistance TerB family protein [Pasteurella multocida]|uniref:tellurite resistance TerB family protein n=1 Tax=Pasteurella multocida TaxID=747 RepID=UPI002024C1B2|nr:tellurite resistance TerB family protein [Pasteurella multocida]MDT8768259.1 tellurite resistance TerB family protein [Pasteurella multocida]URJ87598.1 tellurite resistance TerB family protein [Pasteurella multocida]URJ89591.1 tellurite resistance TerB family protein [Pasteurella multocida]HDR0619282.1 tellurite resistance TerB family protein [Pasteurella multocida]HDR1188017.1 tellurite resistance TerB family protein [Pasteurella multocida]